MNKLRCTLIGIHGKSSSGKDTLGIELSRAYASLDIFAQRYAFADTLKDVCMEMFNLSSKYFHEEGLKNIPVAPWNVSPRQIMQFVGTELVRNNIDKLLGTTAESLWITVLEQKLSHYKETATVIITDVRFQDEYDWIIKNNGKIIHLTRPGYDGKVGIPSHQSEADINLHSKEKLYEIVNDGTFEDLENKVSKLIPSLVF